MAAADWIAHAEAEVQRAQQALDDLDDLNPPTQWGEIDVARQRSELLAALDEYVRDAAYWRNQLKEQASETWGHRPPARAPRLRAPSRADVVAPAGLATWFGRRTVPEGIDSRRH